MRDYDLVVHGLPKVLVPRMSAGARAADERDVVEGLYTGAVDYYDPDGGPMTQEAGQAHAHSLSHYMANREVGQGGRVKLFYKYHQSHHQNQQPRQPHGTCMTTTSLSRHPHRLQPGAKSGPVGTTPLVEDRGRRVLQPGLGIGMGMHDGPVGTEPLRLGALGQNMKGIQMREAIARR